MRMVAWCLLFLLFFGLNASVRAARSAIGGGVPDAGFRGEYFANDNLLGQPAFTRKEVRVRFDWGTLLPVGGSTAEPYASFPHEHFSLRLTGQVMPRFSESYTFHLTFAAGARMKIRAENTTTWTTLVEQWGKPGDVQAKAFPMQAGRRYDVQIEYHHLTGAASLILRWSSPTTPEEVVEPASESGLNLASWNGYCLADRGKEGRWWRIDGKEPTTELMDENGWPKFDAEFIPFEASKTILGTYLVSFTGKAALTFKFIPAKFVVDGKDYAAQLPRGVGYNAATNTTTATLVVEGEEGTAFMPITQSSRSGSDTVLNTGITDLQIMRPIALGATDTHQLHEVTYRPMKSLAECFTCLRWLGVANANAITTWAARTPANYRAFEAPEGADKLERGENWEDLIMFANETGRDLYLCTPVAADNDYLTKFAKLLKYGSDGMEPYDAPQAHPKYPPLNSNLCVYFEIGNEIWNWAFASTGQALNTAANEVQQKSDDGKIVNFDGKAGDKGLLSMRRWLALRTVRACETFRTVFGDEAYGARFRPLIEYQYANAQSTAVDSFDFLDSYFNNGAGDLVKDPHPIPYYIWGGGGAAYYGVGNPEGLQTDVLVPDGGFEQAAVAEGPTPATPTESPWRFTGNGGIYRPLNSAVADYSSIKRIRQDRKTAYGFKFKVGDKPLYVRQLGRVFSYGCEGATLRLLKADDNSEVMKGDTGGVHAYLTKIFGYYYSKAAETPVRLEPNTSYYLLATANGDGEDVAADDTQVANAGPGLTLLNAVKAEVTDANNPATWKFSDGQAGSLFGPVTFLYAMSPDVAGALPQPPQGQQAAILRGNAEMAVPVNVPKTGKFALTFNATGPGAFQVWVDDQPASARAQSDYRVADANGNCGIGGWGRNNGFKEEWGSAVFSIERAGPHTIKFVGKSKPDGFMVFDDMRIASLDAIMTSGFGGGSALGQPEEHQWGDSQRKDSALVTVYGLARVSYETGWSLGGDFYQKPIQNYAKFMDPRATVINDTAINIFQQSNGWLPVWGVYTYWPNNDFAHGRDYPIMKSFLAAAKWLPADSDNGISLPGTLNAANAVKWWWNAPVATLNERGSYLSWTVVAPVSGAYLLRLQATGTGGVDVNVDGWRAGQPLTVGQPAEIQLTLRKGVHGIRIRNTGGNVTIQVSIR